MISLKAVNIIGFQVPVGAILPSPDLEVKLYLQSIMYQSGDSISGTTYVPVTNAVYPLSNPIPIGSQYNYATVLQQKHLPNPGYYYGYIEATQRNSNNITPIHRENIVIEVSEPELGYTSKVAGLNGWLSYSEIIEQLYARTIQVPLPHTIDEQGRLVMYLVSGPALPLVFKASDGGPLKQGSYIKIFHVETGRQMSLEVPSQDGKRITVVKEIMLGLTDIHGVPLGLQDAKPITSGQASYSFVYNLPIGKYYAIAYYAGQPVSSPVNFSFPLENC